jgi:alpha-galactosidase
MNKAAIIIKHLEGPLDIASFEDNSWDIAEPVGIGRYWCGDAAPEHRLTQARLLWSEEELYVRFDAAQQEPLVINDQPNLAEKNIGLWERDVCEIFMAPDATTPNKYFEFEVAPTGEWVDLAIEMRKGERITDWEYSSGMRTAAFIGIDKVTMSIAIPFASLMPEVGDVWLGNLFRCVGSGPTRGYLAWQPTMTEKPNFHIPERFGQFLFV